MRIVHMADLHLDHSFVGDGGPFGHGNHRREAVRAAFRTVIERCMHWPADALLIAGDLFDADHVTPDTLAFLKQGFADLGPVPVFIAPGNRDAHGPDSPYGRYPWPPNVRVFLSPGWEFFEVDQLGLTVHGFAHGVEPQDQAPFDSFDGQSEDRVHVLLAHGAEQGLLPAHQKPCAVFDRTVLSGKGLTYAALGHIHAAHSVPLADGCVLQYPGAPEPLGFDVPGPGSFAEVTIENGTATVETAYTGAARYASVEVALQDTDNAAEAIDRMRAAWDAGTEFVRIRLIGPAPEWFDGDTAALAEGLSAHCAWAHITDTMDLAPDASPHDSVFSAAFAETLREAYWRAGSESEKDRARRAYYVGFSAAEGRSLAWAKGDPES